MFPWPFLTSEESELPRTMEVVGNTSLFKLPGEFDPEVEDDLSRMKKPAEGSSKWTSRPEVKPGTEI